MIKVMWDCRSDWTEIRASYGVEMKGVLDLQLAEMRARMRSEGGKPGGWIWCVSGMQRSSVEYRVFGYEDKASSEKSELVVLQFSTHLTCILSHSL